MGIDSTKTIIKRLSLMSSVLAGMTAPFPALEVLRHDVAAAQQWLQETDENLNTLISEHEEEMLNDIKKDQLEVSGEPVHIIM